ncbi:adenylate/guanylate cyclase domain-containing protein (plasmid) [Shinella sp. H4-D48]|uniref:CHASE2 domain-containing protein n=1 Tax=Shinella sp. H4-D48 TaxID=2925841 RepID=UPI001F53CE35|nr:adenylate/guanylate cyclase domain-containing protein [Shinella sp. H4-D48]UNK40635.1 adenylate/guanylate cyclase domain-containing protein [Shinella sp. H4-D48]
MTASVGGAALLLCLATLRSFPAATDIVSDSLFDAYQRIQPRPDTEQPPVAVVDIDEASIASLGQWPWSRDVIARMVDRLTAAGVAAIGFDIVFSEPDRLSLEAAAENLRKRGARVDLPLDAASLDSDAALAESLSRAPAAVGLALTNENGELPPQAKAGFAYGGHDPRTYLPHFRGAVRNLDGLHAVAPGAGFFSFENSRDHIIRTMPLAAVSGDRLYPALAMETLRLALGAPGFQIRSNDASGDGGGGSPGMSAMRVGELTVPTAPDGSMRVYFSGLARMPVVGAATLLEANSDLSMLEGRIVLIGTSAVGLRDIVATPVSLSMPGVNIHAEIVDQIVAGIFLKEPDWAPGAILIATLLMGGVLVWVASRCAAQTSALLFAGLVSLCFAASWLSFARARTLLDPTGTVMTMLVIFLALTPLRLALENREKRFVKNAFGRYLAPALVERLAQEPEALELGGETRRLTVLFSDIRGFTSLSEGMDPQALTGLINDVLTPLTDVLLTHEATIDKYIGDAIMAFWNAPLDIVDHESKACRAALDMVRAVERLNLARSVPIRVGIGLNSGAACVGNLGSAHRFSYSALGDSVNLASRIESLTKFYGVTIAVSEFTRQAVADLAFLEADFVRVKGRAAPVRLYTLLGDEVMAQSEDFVAVKRRHDAFLDLYRAGDFRAAGEALATLRAMEIAELSGLYALYAERLAELAANPPEAGWDGVFVAQGK